MSHIRLSTFVPQLTTRVEPGPVPDATITADKLTGRDNTNVPGNPPVFGCRAWVNFNGNVAADVTATWVSTNRITWPGHNVSVGNQFWLESFGGTPGSGGTAGIYTVTSILNSNSFTHNRPFGPLNPDGGGSVTIRLRSIRNAGNVNYVSTWTTPTSPGRYIINFKTPMPHSTYTAVMFNNASTTSESANNFNNQYAGGMGDKTTSCMKVASYDSSTWATSTLFDVAVFC
jgi:hypothetical protein